MGNGRDRRLRSLQSTASRPARRPARRAGPAAAAPPPRELRIAADTPPDPAAPAGGLFVAFEGGDGAGKSTQASLLAGWLRERGHTVCVTREPGATPIGGRLRELLLDPASAIPPRCEVLLYAADRAAHVETVIAPALARGEVVVTDRYADSSIAYQGAGRALPAEEVAQLSAWATGGLRPHLTVLLDVDPAVGLRRATGPGDRIEAESLEFHHRVRAGFRALAAQRPAAYLVCDAGLPAGQVAAEVRGRVAALLPGPAAGSTAGGPR